MSERSNADHHHYHHHSSSLFAAGRDRSDAAATAAGEANGEDTFVLARTSKEITSFRMMQDALKKLKITMRSIKDTNVLHVCSVTAWKRQINQYMEQIGIFSFVGPLTTTFTGDAEGTSQKDTVQSFLHQINHHIISTVRNLLHHRAINAEHYGQMMSCQPCASFQVSTLYFVPELRHDDICLQPMLTNDIKEPIRTIASFLNVLLQPLIDDIIHSSVALSTGTEAIAALECYARRGYLRSTTLFATIDILDLGHTLPHDLMLEGLEKFLSTHVPHDQLEGISNTTFVRLVQLVLQNQFYLFESQLYQQTAGGPMQTCLIRALIDIYLFHVQTDLVRILTEKNELFGRSLNQIFLTWNGTKDELLSVIRQHFLMQSTDTSLRITISIASHIQYLDAEVSHADGALQTRVYHNSKLEPHALPFLFPLKSITSRFPLVLYRAALLRAILYCCNTIEFANERLFLDVSFIINDVPLDSMQKTYRNLLSEFELIVSIRDPCLDEDTYQDLRQRVRHYEQQRTSYSLNQRRRRRKYRQRQIIKHKNQFKT